MAVRPVTREIAQYIVDFSYDDLPPETIQAAKEAILDQFGIILMGSTLPWTRPAYEFATELNSRAESTILGHGTKVASVYAAMVNSNYAHSCEFDDTGYSGGTHAGSISVAAAMALAEPHHLPGRDLIMAVVAGYEVLYRIGRVLTRPVSELGFHAQSLVGPFGAATVASKLLNLPHEQVVHALSITGSHSSGTMEYDQRGGEVKRFHSGMAARNGLVAALLAQKGLTGPDTILEGKRGLVRLFGRMEAGEAEGMLEDGDDKGWYAIQGRIVKAYPTVGTIPTSIQAVDYLARTHGFSADDIERIDVWVNPHCLNHGASIVHPKDTIGAQFSMAFSLGLRMLKGGNDLKYYVDPEVVQNPEIHAFADKLHVHGDKGYGSDGETVDWDRYWGGRARVRLYDGREWEREEVFRKGAPQNPMTRDEFHGKFRSLASAVLDDDAIDRVIETVEALEELDDVATLVPLLSRR